MAQAEVEGEAIRAGLAGPFGGEAIASALGAARTGDEFWTLDADAFEVAAVDLREPDRWAYIPYGDATGATDAIVDEEKSAVRGVRLVCGDKVVDIPVLGGGERTRDGFGWLYIFRHVITDAVAERNGIERRGYSG